VVKIAEMINADAELYNAIKSDWVTSSSIVEKIVSIVKNVLPLLCKNKNLDNIVKMGNATPGSDEYLKHFPKVKTL
jgi:hypothetical protein